MSTRPGADAKQVTIYTDGSCLVNPGRGGWGAVLLLGGAPSEISGGFRKTTNNRMELMAVIEGLEALKENCRVTLFSDSQYVVNGMSKGWAKRWRDNGWRRNRGEPAINPDLWERLLAVAERHDVDFEWVRGHMGNVENERADKLANAAARGNDLPPDPGYSPKSR